LRIGHAACGLDRIDSDIFLVRREPQRREWTK
jgi:hypothetical protein